MATSFPLCFVLSGDCQKHRGIATYALFAPLESSASQNAVLFTIPCPVSSSLSPIGETDYSSAKQRLPQFDWKWRATRLPFPCCACAMYKSKFPWPWVDECRRQRSVVQDRPRLTENLVSLVFLLAQPTDQASGWQRRRA